LTNTRVNALAVAGTDLIAGTEGGGVWRRLLSEMTSVERSSVEVPSHFRLEQNFPNPFNPATSIRYQIRVGSHQSSVATHVRLAVHDLLGREAAVLVNEEKPAGVYRATWDAAGMPSGVYFYKLMAGAFVETRKMVLMK
jgi:hypothetical protein